MRGRSHLAVFGLCLGLVALYTWPLVRDLAHLWPDNTDPSLFTWVMVTIFRNLTTRPEALFHGNAFYPYGQSLTFAEPLLTPALVAGPLAALTGNPVLAYNVTLLLFWALSGWAMYAVAFRLTRRHAAAFVAAAIFTLAPYRTELYVEFQMEMAFGIPLAVYGLVRFLETQRARHLLAFLAVFWLQAVAVWYYAVILALGLATVAAQYVALRWSGWRPRTLVYAGVGGAVLAAALAPVAWPFFVTRRELGFERGLGEVGERAADVLTYLELRPNWLYPFQGGGHLFETSLFLGGVGLALAVLGLGWLGGRRASAGPRAERWLARGVWMCLALAGVAGLTGWRIGLGHGVRLSFSTWGVGLLALALARHAVEGWRRRRTGLHDRALGEREWVAILLGLAATGFLLSLGPEVEVGGRVVGPGLYAWLYPYLLPLRAIRAATRFGVLVLFAGALLAGFGVAWLSARLPRPAARATVAVASLLLLAEYATFPLPYQVVPSPMRPVDAVLRRAGGDGVVLEWPTYVPGVDTDAMFRSLGHGRPVVNGYSGFVPDLIPELSDLFTRPGPPFPVPEAQAALRRIYPLRYLVVRLGAPAVDTTWRPAWLALRQDPLPLLRFRGTYGDEDLYEIVPLPERGRSMERLVSYEFLQDHRVLRLGARPLVTAPDLDQWVDLLLDGRPVRRLPLDRDLAATVGLAPPFHRAAPNVLALRYGYHRRAPAAEADYRIGRTATESRADIAVRSGGQAHGNVASIQVNGSELAPGGRGYNLVALEPSGRLLGAATFDTFAAADASGRLAAWVGALPAGTIVIGAVKDEASGQLGEAAVRALETLGVAGDLRGRFRESHAFVGVRGARPGSAREALGPRLVDLVVGRPRPDAGVELEAFELVAR